jgi:hypothetical protein
MSAEWQFQSHIRAVIRSKNLGNGLNRLIYEKESFGVVLFERGKGMGKGKSGFEGVGGREKRKRKKAFL